MKLIRVIILLCVLLGLLITSLPVYAQSTIEGDIGSVAGSYTPSQISSFYAAGRYWVFYTMDDGGADEDMYVESSTDGTTWEVKTLICTVATDDTGASIFFDGTYVHYVAARAAGSVQLYYRRGTPNANGSITWSAVEQTALAAVGTYPYVSVDTNGCPWIGYNNAANLPTVTKSSASNGTWTTDAGFPDQLSVAQGAYMSIISLTGGKMLALYGAGDLDGMQAMLWDGAVWGAERSTTNNAIGVQLYSAVAQDDDVHVVMMDNVPTPDEIIYERYDYATNAFIDATTLVVGVTVHTAPVICRTDLNDLYVFMEDAGLNDDKIYYIKYNYHAGAWGSLIELIDETVLDGLPAADYYLNADYNPDSDKVGVYYVSDPQKLKYKDVAEVANVTTLAPTGVTTTSATLRGEITSTGSGSVTVRGIQYNTTPSATGAGYTEESGSFSTGVYSFPVTDFEADELYYCRAYVTNAVGTSYGEWVAWISAVQGGEPEQPDEPDEGMAPPVDTEGPVNWVTDPSLRTFDSWPFSDVINAFADMVSRSFAWFCFMVFAVSLVGIALCKYTRHLGITFLALGMLLGLYIAGDAIDWWLIFPYLLVGISLIIKEQQYGWG